MARLTKCSNCAGELFYDPEEGMLSCERCGSTFIIKEKPNQDLRRLYDVSYSPAENNDIQTLYRCSNCDSKIIAGTLATISRCSSCGDTSLIKENGTVVVPDAIIPFKITRNQAANIFRKWVGNRKLAPSDLKQMAKLEKISGIYTPVWSFNYKSFFRYSVVGVKKRLDEEDNEIRQEYPIRKVVDKAVENEIHSASSRISDEMLEKLGEYNFAEMRPYSTDYLLGFTGVATNKDIHKTYNEIINNINEKEEKRIKNNLNDEYDYIKDFTSSTKLKDVSFSYANVPVWANHYTYKGKEYHCFINGQTGEATGKAPKSIAKISAIVLGVLASVGGLVILISSLI